MHGAWQIPDVGGIEDLGMVEAENAIVRFDIERITMISGTGAVLAVTVADAKHFAERVIRDEVMGPDCFCKKSAANYSSRTAMAGDPDIAVALERAIIVASGSSPCRWGSRPGLRIGSEEGSERDHVDIVGIRVGSGGQKVAAAVADIGSLE